MPPVLDINWKNCDIKVVMQANIPMFGKLDNTLTPLKLFELFFDDIWLL